MLGGNLILFGVLASWLTPIWLICVGSTLGLLVLVLAYGLLRLISPGRAAVVPVTIKEGLLLPLFYLTLLMAGIAVVGTMVVPYRALLGAVSRVGAVGAAERDFEIPKTTKSFAVPLFFRPSELQAFEISSDQPIVVTTRLSRSAGPDGSIKLPPGQTFRWTKPSILDKSFPPDLTEWTASNLGPTPAKLTVRSLTDIEFPEVRVVLYTAIGLLGVVGAYLAIRFLAPKVAAIALATSKEVVSQPVFYLLLAVGLFALLVFIYVPYNTFGEDVKMLKDSGLTLIMVLSIFVAVWSASVSVADEIEGRTALTLLSKPIHRWQFIVGKFVGILGPVVLMFIVLGLWFLVTVSYKVVYDARETAQAAPTWQACYVEMIRTVPGLVLAFLETVTLTAISVAISTRLPMLANLIVCASIYVLGHLVPMIVNSSLGKLDSSIGNIVVFFGQFIATVLPVLDHFNIQAAVAAGKSVPTDYLLWALLYCCLYSSIAMLLALLMFEDRDLA